MLYWVLQPGSNIGGIGMGLVRMVRPWNEWLIVWGYDINAEPPTMTDELATEIAHNLIGDHTHPDQDQVATRVWTVNNMYATRIRRRPCVLHGRRRASPSALQRPRLQHLGPGRLQPRLETRRCAARPSRRRRSSRATTHERAPIAKQIVTRANQSIAEFGPIFEALGLLNTDRSGADARPHGGAQGQQSEAAAQREALRKAIAFKDYEFNCHGVELNQRYVSSAIVEDPLPTADFTRDRELYYHPTTRAGAHLPHAWLCREGKPVSTLDVAGKGQFVLLTGIAGEVWAAAASTIAAASGLPMIAIVIGPGRDYEDPFGAWALIREVEEAGAVLIRPDMMVGWRALTAASSQSEAEDQLGTALAEIFGREAKNTVIEVA